MPPLLSQGSRPFAPTAIAATPQAGGRPAHGQTTPASGKVAAALPVVERVAAQQDSVHLSAEALTSRAAQDAGKTTLDIARTLLDSFTSEVFGDGSKLQLEHVSLDSAASFSASGAATTTPDGSSASASLSLTQSAHFVGTGQIVTEDGQRFDVDIEVNYEASIGAAAELRAPDDSALTGKQLPAIKFPGSLGDLFKVLGRQLTAEGGDNGRLTLRLMRLVDRAALLAPRLPGDDVKASPAARQQAASAYASAPAPADD